LLAPSVVLGEGAPLAVAMLHLLFGGLTVWLVWRLGCRWGLAHRAALLASGLVAVDPILINRAGQIVSETLATLLAVVALHALTSFSNRPSLLRAGLAGACLGLGILCQPAFAAWLACSVALLPAALGQTFPWRIRWSQACVCLLGAAAVAAPWAVRNQMQFGVPIVTTTHGGYALLLGNNPSVYDHLRSGAWRSDWDTREFDAMWLGEQQAIGANEVSRDRLAYALAWQNIRDEPSMFLLSSLAHVGSLWGLVPSQETPFEGHRARFLRYATGVWYTLQFMLAALGIFAVGRRIARTPWLWGTLLVVSFTAAQATFGGSLYERAPLAPVLTLLAATGARELWAGRRPIKLAS
jgi:4-amino-4-deoxy-L-arabinose transferase-like glycosyltransferase